MVLEYETETNKGVIMNAVRMTIPKNNKRRPSRINIERSDGSTVSLLYDTIEERDKWYEKLKTQIYAQTYVSEKVPDNRVNLETLKRYENALIGRKQDE